MTIFDNIFHRKNAEFRSAFAGLKRMGDVVPAAKRTYDLLKDLDAETSQAAAEKLVKEVNDIKYGSNTNSVFYFYFPVVTHILYYKPQFEKDLLHHLVGPNFSNGVADTTEMIRTITGAMHFKLKENEGYLTTESKRWILHELPKLTQEVEREIQICQKELDEC